MNTLTYSMVKRNRLKKFIGMTNYLPSWEWFFRDFPQSLSTYFWR